MYMNCLVFLKFIGFRNIWGGKMRYEIKVMSYEL